MKFTHLSHCLYHCEYHLVITTKFRKKIFNEGIFAFFDTKLAQISEHYPLIRFEKVNHDKDHLHLLISLPPTMSVGRAVGIIKQNTAKELKQKFPFLKQVYWGTESVWSEGYFVSTVGINESMIRQYIENQGEKETGQAKLELS